MASFALPSAVTVAGPLTQSRARIFSMNAFCSADWGSVGASWACAAAHITTITTLMSAMALHRSGKRIQILHERGNGSVEPLYFRIGGLDQVVLVGSVGAGSVAEPEVTRRQAQRCGGEHTSRPRSGRTRP